MSTTITVSWYSNIAGTDCRLQGQGRSSWQPYPAAAPRQGPGTLRSKVRGHYSYFTNPLKAAEGKTGNKKNEELT